jgi:hypothetical protein
MGMSEVDQNFYCNVGFALSESELARPCAKAMAR